MIQKFITLISIFSLLSMPIAAAALEQSFTQNNLKATVKLSPDDPTAGSKTDLALKLEENGQPVTDKKVTLEVYEKEGTEPVLKREVDVLEDVYLDSWNFEKPGEYMVLATVADLQKPSEALRYQINVTVSEAKDSQHEHGFFSHHFGGGKWGWWGAGLMLLIMVPMMAIAL